MMAAVLKSVRTAIVPVSANPFDPFLVTVDDQSMFDPQGEKSYRKGDIVTVDPNKEARHESMVVVYLEREGTAKLRQLVIEANGGKFLRSINPSWPNQIVELPSYAKVHGVVTGKWVAE